MFLNLTNHSSKTWSKAQTEATKRWGPVTDMAFPAVPAGADRNDIYLMADEYLKKIEEMKPDCVCCQGEMTLSFRLVSLLKERGIRCVAACSERQVHEEIQPDGSVIKTMIFNFVGYREY